MNLALLTYFIPAAFLAVPMYRTMGLYGLLNNQWALILAMVTIASPYAIWVLKQSSDQLPVELDEAAIMDGASPMQLLWFVYVPLMAPALVAIGTYALLLAWNEYLYAFLLLSKDTTVTLPVGLGNFLAADDSPWELLMTTGLIYALPPAAIYYVFRRYMVSGLTRAPSRVDLSTVPIVERSPQCLLLTQSGHQAHFANIRPKCAKSWSEHSGGTLSTTKCSMREAWWSVSGRMSPGDRLCDHIQGGAFKR